MAPFNSLRICMRGRRARRVRENGVFLATNLFRHFRMIDEAASNHYPQYAGLSILHKICGNSQNVLKYSKL